MPGHIVVTFGLKCRITVSLPSTLGKNSLVVTHHCKTNFQHSGWAKCHLDEVDKAMFQGVDVLANSFSAFYTAQNATWSWLRNRCIKGSTVIPKYIFYLLTSRKCDLRDLKKAMFQRVA